VTEHAVITRILAHLERRSIDTWAPSFVSVSVPGAGS
jgi:hypothetical protein